MSYRYQSQQTADIREMMVQQDLARRGFVSARMTRDHLYDLVMERSHVVGASPVFETIQVKPGALHTTTPISTRGGIDAFAHNARVSETGKPRNNTLYRDYCIDWIAAVDVDAGRIWYYAFDTYRHLTEIRVGRTPETDIGDRTVPHHRVGRVPLDSLTPTLY